MSFYLGVDAGGTKTDFLLADESRVIARVRSGTIKRMRADEVTVTNNLDKALRELTAASGIAMSSVSRTCIGTAGETVPLVTDWLRQAFGLRVSGALTLVGDVEIALDAAFPAKPGIIVLAGTGSNVAGRARDGSLYNAGGWGPALGDQGSGHRIGLQAVRAAFMAIDESPDPREIAQNAPLLRSISEFWNLKGLNELVEYANGVPAPDFSALTGLVVACAESGDKTAQDVLRCEGESLGYLVLLVARRLHAHADDAEWAPRIAFTGSILEKVQPVREALLTAVRREFPSLETPAGVIDPLEGAIWRARNG